VTASLIGKIPGKRLDFFSQKPKTKNQKPKTKNQQLKTDN